MHVVDCWLKRSSRIGCQIDLDSSMVLLGSPSLTSAVPFVLLLLYLLFLGRSVYLSSFSFTSPHFRSAFQRVKATLFQSTPTPIWLLDRYNCMCSPSLASSVSLTSPPSPILLSSFRNHTLLISAMHSKGWKQLYLNPPPPPLPFDCWVISWFPISVFHIHLIVVCEVNIRNKITIDAQWCLTHVFRGAKSVGVEQAPSKERLMITVRHRTRWEDVSQEILQLNCNWWHNSEGGRGSDEAT